MQNKTLHHRAVGSSEHVTIRRLTQLSRLYGNLAERLAVLPIPRQRQSQTAQLIAIGQYQKVAKSSKNQAIKMFNKLSF